MGNGHLLNGREKDRKIRTTQRTEMHEEYIKLIDYFSI